MATVVWKQEEWMAHLRKQIIDGLVAIGLEAKNFVQTHTPWRTGYARRSVYFAVYDDRGEWVAGDRIDGNGIPVPAVAPAIGRFRVIVGANAPYYIWIEIGARGRPGHHALQHASELISRRVVQYTLEAKAAAR